MDFSNPSAGEPVRVKPAPDMMSLESQSPPQASDHLSGLRDEKSGTAAQWFRERLLKQTKGTRDEALESAAAGVAGFVNGMEVCKEDATEAGLTEAVRSYLDSSALKVHLVSEDVSGVALLDVLCEAEAVSQGEYAKLAAGAARHGAPSAVLQLSLDEKFESSIDWSVEGERAQRWREGRSPPPPFLFAPPPPREHGSSGGGVFAMQLEYGVVPEVVVAFKHPRAVDSWRPVQPSLRPLLGRKVAFRGRGLHLDVDRIFVRSKISEVQALYGPFVSHFTVRFPSALVSAGRTFTVGVGKPESELDWARWNGNASSGGRAGSEGGADRAVDVLLCVSANDERVTEGMRRMLASSGLIKRAAAGRHHVRFVYAVDTERSGASAGAAGQRGDTLSSLSLSRSLSFPELAEDLREFLAQTCATKGLRASDRSIGNLEPEVLAIAPSQFLSLSHGTISKGRKVSLQRATNMPRLSSIFANAALSMCASTVESISSDWEKAMAAGVPSPSRSPVTAAPVPFASAAEGVLSANAFTSPSPSLSSSPAASLMEQMRPELQMNRLIGEKFAEARTRVTDATQRLEYTLCKRARESYEASVKKLPDFQQRYMSSPQSCRLLLSPASNGVCLGADLLALMCGPLLAGVPGEWVAVIPQMIADVELLVTACAANVLKHTTNAAAGTMRIPIGRSGVERACTRRMLEVSKALEGRIARRLNLMKTLLANVELQQECVRAGRSVLKTAVLDRSGALPPHVGRYHELVEDALPDVPTKAMRMIHRTLSSTLLDVQNMIQGMEREVQGAATAILKILSLSQQQTPTDTPPMPMRSFGTVPPIATVKDGSSPRNPLQMAQGFSAMWAKAMSSPSAPAQPSAFSTALSARESASTARGASDSMAVAEAPATDVMRMEEAEADDDDGEQAFDPMQLSAERWSEGKGRVDVPRFLEMVAATGGSVSAMQRRIVKEAVAAPHPQCQFRALARAKYGDEASSPVLRLLLAREVATHRATYRPFVSRMWRVSVDEYVHVLAEGNRAGDAVTLLAAANAFRCPVHVLSPILPRPVVIRPSRLVEGSVRGPLTVALIGPNKYVTVVRADEAEAGARAGADAVAQQCGVKRGLATLGGAVDAEAESMAMEGGEGEEDGAYRAKRRRVGGSSAVVGTNEPQLVPGSEDGACGADPMCLTASSFKLHVTPHVTRHPGGTATPRSLAQLCVRTVGAVSHLLPPLDGYVPDEVVQQLLDAVVERHALTDTVLRRLLQHSGIRALAIRHCQQLSYSACIEISKHVHELVHLDLSGCASVPSEGLQVIVASAPHLRTLDVSSCVLADNRLLVALAKHCRSLTHLNVSGCALIGDGGVRALLLRCPQLVALHLQGLVHITDHAFSSSLPASLELLDLSECVGVSLSTALAAVTDCSQLRRFAAVAGTVEPEHVEAIRGMTSLESLDLAKALWDPSLTRALSNALSSLPKLRCLKLRHCHAQGLAELFQPPADAIRAVSSFFLRRSPPSWSLRELDLSRSDHVTDAVLAQVVRVCRQLEQLDLSACDVSDEALDALTSALPGIRRLMLSKCVRVSDAGVALLAKRCRGLEHLSLFSCAAISDHAMVAVAGACPKLRTVDVGLCEKLSDRFLVALAGNCCALQTLCVEGLAVSDAALAKLLVANPRISRLDVSSCAKLTNASLDSMVMCPELQELVLDWCKLSSEAIAHAVREWSQLRSLSLRGTKGWASELLHHPTLQVLNLSWCAALTDEALGQLVEGCPALHSLDVSWCQNITLQGLEPLLSRSPMLSVLSVRGCSHIPSLRHFAEGRTPVLIHQ